MKITKRIKAIIAGMVIVIIAGGVYAYYHHQETTKQSTSIETAQVERQNLKSTVSATGTISPTDSVEVSPKITARISSVLVKENDRVEAGQTVATLDGKDYQAKYDQAQYKVTNTKLDYERYKMLYEQGAGTKQAMDNAEYEYNTAVSTLSAAESDLAETTITAPMSGVVVGDPKPVGTMAVQGNSNPTVIMRIADTTKNRFLPKSTKRISVRSRLDKMRPSPLIPLPIKPLLPMYRKYPRPIRAIPGILTVQAHRLRPLRLHHRASSTTMLPLT